MKLPRSISDSIFAAIFYLIVLLFSTLALFRILNRTALIASIVWLVLVVWMIWSTCKAEAVGLDKFLINRLGDFAGKKFMLRGTHHTQATEVHFGYELFGHRFYQLKIPIEKIKSVKWTTGQATAIAGRDMEDWVVFVIFDRDHSLKQGIHAVGPARRKEETEAFGLLVVDFLRSSGVELVQDEKNICFVRERPHG